MAGAEFDVEPCYYRVNEVVSLGVEEEWIGECEVFGCASVKVKFEDHFGVCDDGFEFDGIYEWLRECGMF